MVPNMGVFNHRKRSPSRRTVATMHNHRRKKNKVQWLIIRLALARGNYSLRKHLGRLCYYLLWSSGSPQPVLEALPALAPVHLGWIGGDIARPLAFVWHMASTKVHPFSGALELQ